MTQTAILTVFKKLKKESETHFTLIFKHYVLILYDYIVPVEVNSVNVNYLGQNICQMTVMKCNNLLMPTEGY